MPLRALLDQFAPNFPGFRKVGTGHNKKIDFDAKGFLAVTDSVHMLKKIKFHSVFVDEAHHPLPPEMPRSAEMYRFSATHTDEPDFRYTMGQAIEDGVLCDYDITVPALTAHHAYVCLGDLLLKQVGRFRRVLAYCNSIAEAKRFRMVLRELGLAAWHINAKTPLKKRETVIEEFAGPLQKPVHVLVTVEVLGEGINIPNADTCMFVEPRNSYRSIIQAVGRVLRHHPAKTLAHIVLPAVAIPNSSTSQSGSRKETKGPEQAKVREAGSLQISKPQKQSRSPPESDCELQTVQVEPDQQARIPQTSGSDKDEVVSRQKSVAAISVDAPPAVTWRQVGSNGQQRDKLCSILNGDVDANRETDSSNYDERSTKISPSAATDHQQESVQQKHPLTRCGSMNSANGHRPPTHTSQEEVQTEHWERVKQGFNPTAVGRPGMIGYFPDQTKEEPNVQKTISSKQRQGFKLKASGGSHMFNQQFHNQLERFLSTLMVADHRLVGATAGQRIQVADCTLVDAGASITEGWTTEIYNRLSAILSGDDRWEKRLRELEMFINKHARLPRRECESHYERALGTWLNSQCGAFGKQRLPLHRFQKLLASSPLIRRRVDGWQMKDTDGIFGERCHQLGEYVQLHNRLPASGKLAKWMANMRGGSIRLSPDKIQMQQDVHPLVKAELKKWQDAPRLQRPQWERKFGQLSGFVLATGRLPKRYGEKKVERRCYQWLRVQCRRLLAGHLPDDMAQQLRNADPLIAAYIDAST